MNVALAWPNVMPLQGASSGTACAAPDTTPFHATKVKETTASPEIGQGAIEKLGLLLGLGLGDADGDTEGERLGEAEKLTDGEAEELVLAETDGDAETDADGDSDGDVEGLVLGLTDGDRDSEVLGDAD